MTPAPLRGARINVVSAVAAGLAACIAMLGIGLWGMTQWTTEAKARSRIGNYRYGYDIPVNVPIGEPLKIEECLRAVAPHGGSCQFVYELADHGMRAEGSPRNLPRTHMIEGPWGHGLLPGRYELTQGRWPTAPGETVAVGPELTGISSVSSWGGRIRLTVVGEARMPGYRGDSFLLIAPGTWDTLSGADLELSGIVAVPTIYFQTPGRQAVVDAERAMGINEVGPPPVVWSREVLADMPYNRDGYLTMLIPAFMVAAAGGAGAAAISSRWRVRVSSCLYRQGVERSLSRRWLWRAQAQTLLMAVPLGGLLGYALSWPLRPAVTWLIRRPSSDPMTLQFLPMIIVTVLLSGLAFVTAPRLPTGRWLPRLSGRTVAWAAAACFALAIWLDGLTSLDRFTQLIFTGVLFSAGLGLVAPMLLRGVQSVRPGGLRGVLALRSLAAASGRVAGRLALIVMVVGSLTTVVAAVAVSVLMFSEQLSARAHAPAQAVLVTTVEPQVARRLPQWAEGAGAAAHPMWFTTIDADSGATLMLVEDQAGAELLAGRPLTGQEFASLKSGAVLTPGPDQRGMMRIGPKRDREVPTHPLEPHDRYLVGQLGIMLHSAWLGIGLGDPGPPQFALMAGGGEGLVERVTAAAVDQGIGETYYMWNKPEATYRGQWMDRLQPWLLGAISVVVMSSLIGGLAAHLRPLRSALHAMGLPARVGGMVLLVQSLFVVGVVVVLGTVPALLALLLEIFRGLPAPIPWRAIGRNVLILVGASLAGALIGSRRLRMRERFQS